MFGKRLVKLVVSLGYWAISGVASRLQGRGRFVVLYYHGVPGESGEGFARQMDAARRWGRIVPADYDGPIGAGDRLVAITFDDAFVSVGEHAVPVLVERGMPATVFAPSDCLGEVADWEMGERARATREAIMTGEQLRELPELISVGCHSARHARLPTLDDAKLYEEVVEAKARLEDVLGQPVATFSFPYGAHDERVVRACRRAGYTKAFSIEPRCAEATDFVRGRVAVEPDDWRLEFFLKVRGAYGWMVHASALKRRVSVPRPVSGGAAVRTGSQV